MNIKELPVVKPRFYTYHWLAAGGIASGSNQTVDNWYLNNSFQIKLSKDFLIGNKKMGLTVDCAHPWDMPFLQKHSVENMFIKDCFDLVVKEMINNNYYILFTGLDDYYMKGKSLYNKIHVNHDGIITGYDDIESTYTVSAYDERWIFNSFKIPQSYVNKAFSSEFVNYDGRLLALQFLKDIPVELDIKLIIDNLAKYLDSNLKKYPKELVNENASGIVFYDYVIMYLDMIINKQISPNEADHRIFKMIFDSKKCMLDMFEKVEKTKGFFCNFSERYREIVNIAGNINLLYSKFKIQKNVNNLLVIKDRLYDMKNKEFNILSII